jgi:hypothetical protein
MYLLTRFDERFRLFLNSLSDIVSVYPACSLRSGQFRVLGPVPAAVGGEGVVTLWCLVAARVRATGTRAGCPRFLVGCTCVYVLVELGQENALDAYASGP